MREQLLQRRDRFLASPNFQRWAARFPLTRFIARRRARELFDITAGFVYSQVLYACVQLDLFQILASGPLELEELVRRTGLPSERLLRLVQAACSLRLLQRRGESRFGLGDLGAASLGNPGIAAMVRHHQRLYADLSDPVKLLQADSATSLSSFWPYARGEDGEAEDYSQLMADSQVFVADEILQSVSLRDVDQLWDIAGGDGTFMSAALNRWPHLRGTVLDLPPVAARASKRFEREYLATRASAQGASMFEDPLAGQNGVGDHRVATWESGRRGLISLIRVLHDHDDGPVLQLLTRLRQSWPPLSRLMIAEPMADTPGAEPMGHAYFGLYLMAMGSGRPRTVAELTSLVNEAGFTRCREVQTGLPLLLRILIVEP
ncbi:MAG: methyltransferase [Pseudomonadota bacterium]